MDTIPAAGMASWESCSGGESLPRPYSGVGGSGGRSEVSRLENKECEEGKEIERAYIPAFLLFFIFLRRVYQNIS